MIKRQEKIKQHRLRQSLGELKRKSWKSTRERGKIWTQEEFDHAEAKAAEYAANTKWI